MIHFKKYQYDRLNQLLFFIVFWEITFLILAAFEVLYLNTLNQWGYFNSFPDNLTSMLFLSNAATGLIGGFISGFFEVYLLRHKLHQFTFTTRLLIKICIYLPLIALLVITLDLTWTVFNKHVLFIQPEILNEVYTFVNSGIFWMDFFVISILLLISITAFQLLYWFSSDHVTNFWYGKYNRGREEERVVLFMDMDDSTTIAEKLGHTRFFKLLNECFKDATESVLNHEGRIIAYVGDEVIISWPVNDANELVEFYFGFIERFQMKRDYYRHRYGVFPVFKGGGHAGRVTIGEIGTENKDIVYAGDVMNTASRIEGLCKKYNRSLLISGELLEYLDLPSSYTFQSLGEVTLRGRQSSSKVYSVAYQDQLILMSP